MSVNVYAWPPVGVIGTEWTEIAPVQMSRSMTTGADRRSAIQRKRRVARLTVPGIGRTDSDAGYVEVLKRLLGGVHFVRLCSYPINWHMTQAGDQSFREPKRLLWTEGAVDLEWTTEGTELLWYSGPPTGYTTTDALGFPAVVVTGLPPNTLVARPGEFVKALTSGIDGPTAMIVKPGTTDDTGTVTLRLLTALPDITSAAFIIGAQETAVFDPYPYPRAVQPQSGNWAYEWSFREVFEDEVDGGFVDIDPWV